MEIAITNEQSKTEVTDEITDAIERVINETMKYEECDFEAQVSVTLVDNDEIHQLNKEHRGVDRATDVLSFPMLEFDEDGNIVDADFDVDGDMVVLGDIVISVERAREQALEYGHSLKREMAFLTVHSMLHLLGYDHVDDPEGEKIMNEKQEEILTRLDITRD